MSFRRRLEQSYGVTAKWAQSTLPCSPLPQITRGRDWAHWAPTAVDLGWECDRKSKPTDEP
jgi:hypothetical protein